MADKNLNSITFPGLPDKYKIAQVAEEYSSSSTYAVGDIVNYLGTTYRCTTAITTAENWTAGHWIAVKIADEVTDLKSALTKVDNKLFEYDVVVDTDEWMVNTNTAVTSNGDGTYNVGTSDYGNTVWGGTETIPAGTYKLFGVPIGFTFVSTNTSHTGVVVTNDTTEEKIITLSQSGVYYLGMRETSKPSSSFVVTPYLIKITDVIIGIEANINSIDTEIEAINDKIEDIDETICPNVQLEIDWNISSDGKRGEILLGQITSEYAFTADSIGNHYIAVDHYSNSDYAQEHKISTTGYLNDYNEVFDGTDYIKVLIKKTDGGVGGTSIEIQDSDLASYAIYKRTNLVEENHETISLLSSTIDYINSVKNTFYPFNSKRYYAHLFLGADMASPATNPPLIPSESLFDVQIAKRLGFDVVEGNVHDTSDGKYIVIHGLYDNGVSYLGNQVEDENGDSGENVAIDSLTLSEIQSTYKYRSQEDRYKTSIPSLEEWLTECKINNVIPLVQYCTDESVEITKSIMGDNFILYNGSRDVHNGYIMMYQNKPTLQTVINWCETIKPPLMVCFADTNNELSSSDVKNLIDACHSRGCKIGFAGNYKNVVDNWDLIKAGCDFASSGWDVNECMGTLVNVTSERDFSAFTNSQLASDGMVELSDGDTMTLSTTPETCFLSKGVLRINFIGTIGLMMGDYIKVYHTSEKKFESDGTNGFEISTFYMNQSPNFTIRAVGAVVVKSIQFLADKC